MGMHEAPHKSPDKKYTHDVAAFCMSLVLTGTAAVVYAGYDKNEQNGFMGDAIFAPVRENVHDFAVWLAEKTE
jgi:hypothetical protein